MNYAQYFLSFSLLLLPVCIISQNLVIEYDYELKSLKYFLDKEEINRPVAKAGQAVRVKLINFNNYLYDIKVEETFNERKIGSGKNLFANIQKLGIHDMDGVINMIDQEVNSPSLPVVDTEVYSPPGFDVETSGVALIPPIVHDESSLELWKAYEEARIRYEREKLEIEKEKFDLEQARRKEEMILGYIKEVETGLEKLEDYADNLEPRREDIFEIERAEKLLITADDKVSKLQYNNILPTSAIKSQSISVLQSALDMEGDDDLEDLLQRHNREYELQDMFEDNNSERNDYGELLVSLDPIVFELQLLAPERSNVKVSNTKLETRKSLSTNFYKESQSISDTIASLIEYYQNRDPDLISNLWYLYEEIRNHSFSHTHRSYADKDEVIYTITLSLKDDVPNANMPKEIKLDPITVPVYGGFKINTSVGLNFAQFIDPVQSYYIKDDKIVSQDGDRFIPFITSFIHFYHQGRKSTSIGGSLGIGIPIGGGAGLESASFFVGPSLFMGNSKRIIINLGLMGGKVERLGGGLEVGDSLSNGQGFIPLQSNYDVGLYVGLSFNLGR